MIGWRTKLLVTALVAAMFLMDTGVSYGVGNVLLATAFVVFIWLAK